MGGPPLPRRQGMDMEHIIMEDRLPFSEQEIFKYRVINTHP